MISVPSEFHKLIVTPAIERFKAEPTDLGLCFAACVFLFHFSDVYAEHECPKSIDYDKFLEDTRNKIKTKNPAFDIIHAVGIAAKHVVVRNKKLGIYQNLMTKDLTIDKAAAFSDGTYLTDIDGSAHSWTEAKDVITVQTPDGKVHDMLHIVISADTTIKGLFL